MSIYSPKETTGNEPATGWEWDKPTTPSTEPIQSDETTKKLKFNWLGFALLVFIVTAIIITGYLTPFLEIVLIGFIALVYGLYKKTNFQFRKLLWK